MGRAPDQREGRGPGKLHRGLIEAFEAFAQSEFELDAIVEGASLREHLTSMWERTGVKPARLASNALPAGCEALWRDFIALHSCRARGMGGPERITWSDIDAYQRVVGIRLAPWEIEAIRRADTAFLACHAATKKP